MHYRWPSRLNSDIKKTGKFVLIVTIIISINMIITIIISIIYIYGCRAIARLPSAAPQTPNSKPRPLHSALGKMRVLFDLGSFFGDLFTRGEKH